MLANKKREIKNIIYLSISQLITISISIILPRLYLVNYGSEVNGLLNSTNQFLIYLSLFEAGIGTVTLQALYGPIANKETGLINGILSATNQYYRKTGLLYLIGLLLLSIIYPIMADTNLNYFEISLIVFFSGFANVILFFFQGKYNLLLQAEGKNYIISNLNTIINILIAIAKIILILNGFNAVDIIIASFFIRLLQSIYVVYYIKKNYLWIDLSVAPRTELLSQKNYSLIHQFAGMVFQNTDILLLTFFCDLKIVSVYSIYKMVVSHIESVLSILTNSINFAMGQLFQVNKNRFSTAIDTFEIFYSACSFALFSVALTLYTPFIELYTAGIHDKDYLDPFLPVLFVTISLLTIMRTPMLYTINYAGHFKLTTPQSIIETIINLVVSIIGVQFWGIYGVLLGTIIALFYRTNDIIIYANTKILKRSPVKTYFIYAVNICMMLILQYFFNVFTINIFSWTSFIFAGLCCTAISLIAMLLINIVIFRENSIFLFHVIKGRDSCQ